MKTDEMKVMANSIRKTLLKAIHKAGSGHPGGSLSATEILTTLYFDQLNVDPQNPKMANRDKFVLSKGHCAPVLYATLAHRGFFPIEDVMTLRQLGSPFQGHPDMHKVPGVEMSTGSLGQGLSVSVGMALAAKMDGTSANIYTLMGDGELDEGMVWEAAMSASHYKLDNLIAIVDWNGLQIDGKNSDVMTVTPIDEKFAAFGWEVFQVDGHRVEELLAAYKAAVKVVGKPSVIIAKTHKGQGVSFMMDQAGWHGKAPSDQELSQALTELGGE